jgi:hypothetical protein
MIELAGKFDHFLWKACAREKIESANGLAQDLQPSER